MQSAPLTGLFAPIDLYLMGVLPPDEVAPFVVVDPAGQTVTAGGMVTGTVLTVDDVIKANGPRNPAAVETRAFHEGTLLVTWLQPLSDREVAFFDFFAARGEATTPLQVHQGFSKGTENPFAVATQGHGTLTTGSDCDAARISPHLPVPVAICKFCPPLLMGLDHSINEADIGVEGIRNSLHAKVEAAGGAFLRGQTKGGLNHLMAFEHEVRAQAGKHISQVSADALLQLAGQIAASLGKAAAAADAPRPQTPRPPDRVAVIWSRRNGRHLARHGGISIVAGRS